MEILTKHKKKEVIGFKSFVRFLETTTRDKTAPIIEQCMLEDPVYMKWILKNKKDFSYILSFDSEELVLLYQTLKNPIQTLVLAFFNSPFEDEFLNTLNSVHKKQYKDEKEYITEVKKGQQEGARAMIMETISSMEDKKIIRPFQWDLPDMKIIKGEHYNIVENNYTMLYDSGSIALTGPTEKRVRHGMWKHYFENGKLMAQGRYEHGEKSGPWVFMNEEGGLKATGGYQENLKEGEWKEYLDDGEFKIVTYSRGRHS